MTDKPATVHAEDILRSGQADSEFKHISVYYRHEPAMTTYILRVTHQNDRWYCHMGYQTSGGESDLDLPPGVRNSYDTAQEGILRVAGWLAEYLTSGDLERWEQKRKDQEGTDYIAFHLGEVQNILG